MATHNHGDGWRPDCAECVAEVSPQQQKLSPPHKFDGEEVTFVCKHENAKPHSRRCRDCGLKLSPGTTHSPVVITTRIATPDLLRNSSGTAR